MAEDKDWVERRQRLVKCKIHGLHYDPRMTSGCVRCRKEGIDTAPRSRPQLVVLLLALLGITVIVYRIVEQETAGADLAEDEVETVDEPVGSESRQLDTKRYEAGLRAVETAMFETPAEDLAGMGEQIELALQGLSRELRDDASAESRATIQAIAELVGRVSPTELTLDSLQDLRERWARLRDRHFETAMWFVVPRAVNPRTDRAALTAYLNVADDLVSLLDEGMNQVLSLSAPAAPNMVDAEDAAQKQEQWQLYRSDWRQRITELQSRLPQRPGAGADPQILVAAQRLEQAFSEVSSLTSGGLPSEARLDTAFSAVNKARQSFEELLLQ